MQVGRVVVWNKTLGSDMLCDVQCERSMNSYDHRDLELEFPYHHSISSLDLSLGAFFKNVNI